jgi:hypothetical protein
MAEKEMTTQKTDIYEYALHALTDRCKQTVMNRGHLALMAESGHQTKLMLDHGMLNLRGLACGKFIQDFALVSDILISVPSVRPVLCSHSFGYCVCLGL